MRLPYTLRLNNCKRQFSLGATLGFGCQSIHRHIGHSWLIFVQRRKQFQKHAMPNIISHNYNSLWPPNQAASRWSPRCAIPSGSSEQRPCFRAGTAPVAATLVQHASAFNLHFMRGFRRRDPRGGANPFHRRIQSATSLPAGKR
jgi:hypothetical protein